MARWTLLFVLFAVGCSGPHPPLECRQLDTARYYSVVGNNETVVVGHKGWYAIYGTPSPFIYESPIKWCDHADLYGYSRDRSVYLIGGSPYFPR